MFPQSKKVQGIRVQTTIPSQFKKITFGIALAYSLAIPAVDAASMGKINVQSALGQPLKAVLDINATPQELSGMTARLAPQDVFQQAEIPYTRALSSLNFMVDKNAGKPVVRISSDRPIHDPFLDFLVELNWSGGRLVREYTFLLDPPESADKSATEAAIAAPREYVNPTPLTASATPIAPTAKPTEESPYIPTVRPTPPAPAPDYASTPTPAPMPAPAPAPAPSSKSNTAGGDYWTVQKGDTLGEIARETRQNSVSLDQMLAGLYKNNPDAFVGDNMNRLKTGSILNIPSEDNLASLPQKEARSIIQAHASDWNAYRRKLSGAVESLPVTPESDASQVSKGSIGSQVADKATPEAANKDQVKVSRSDATGKKGGPSEEDLIAKDRALKDANERVEQLEKNVGELQKLLELKNQNLAALQQQSLNTTAAAGAATPSAPATPGAAVPEAPPGKAVLSSPLPPPLPAAKVAEETANAAPPAKPAEEDEPMPPSLLERAIAFISSPVGMGSVGALLLAALAYFVAKTRKRAKETAADEKLLDLDMSDGRGNQIDWSEDRPLATSATGAAASQAYSESTSEKSENYDDVDPIAEADVYIAYGRDTQAEELLKDALKKTPQRTALHARLLDIFARRQSVSDFEDTAQALHAITGGKGEDWDKATALASQLNIRSGLFAGGAAAAIPVAAEAMDYQPTPAAPAADKPSFDYNAVNLNLAGETPKEATPAPATEPAAASEAGPEEVNTKLDLAKAYVEMGDTDGAQELLGEVLKEGSEAQQAQAKALLATLAGKWK